MRLKFFLAFMVALLLIPSMGVMADSFEPTASFSITPSTGSRHTELRFDASASRDHRGFTDLVYRWNFDYSNGGEFTEWLSSSKITTYQYTSIGTKTVALEVRDSDGLTDRVFNSITIVEQSAFDAWFTVTPREGDTTQEFEFKASVSTPGGQNTDSYKFRWDFNGDGIWDTTYSTTKVEPHVYPKTGYYTPRLQVMSPGNETLIVIGPDHENFGEAAFVYVTFSNAPQAAIEVSPSSAPTGAVFYFDGSGSFDRQDGRDLEYRWDFNGDGVFEIPWGTLTNPYYQYEAPGSYDAMIQVRDLEGNVDDATINVEVLADRLTPNAAFTISSDRGISDRTIGTTNTTFTFNAGTSRDEETSSAELKVRWDWDADGTWDTSFDTQKQAEHRYLDVGVYTVRLEVRDTDDRRDTAEQTITIVANDAPIPIFSVTPTQGTPGTVFQFNGSDSSDSQYNATQLEARWDWEGDGTWDTEFEKDKTVSHQYNNPGRFQPTLQIRDPEGSVSITKLTVNVVESTAPSAKLSVDVTSGTFSTLFHFDASASSDGETASEDLWYRWDFDYRGENDILYDTSWSRSKTRSKTFTQAGPTMVRVQVKDEDGDITEARVTVDLHWASEYMETLRTRGIIRGYSGGDLAPDRQITRAELLKMVMEAADIKHFRTTYDGFFSDVGRTEWFVQYVETAYEQGITAGYADGTFRPNQFINRAEAMKFILQGFGVELKNYRSGTFPDVSADQWFANYVGTSYELGLVNGYATGNFGPANWMTRGEASKIIALALQGAL